jgi:hypothetical protein
MSMIRIKDLLNYFNYEIDAPKESLPAVEKKDRENFAVWQAGEDVVNAQDAAGRKKYNDDLAAYNDSIYGFFKKKLNAPDDYDCVSLWYPPKPIGDAIYINIKIEKYQFQSDKLIHISKTNYGQESIEWYSCEDDERIFYAWCRENKIPY